MTTNRVTKIICCGGPEKYLFEQKWSFFSKNQLLREERKSRYDVGGVRH